MLLTIIIGLVVFSVLVLTHELGHFIMAKASGVWVEEFGIGFPPRIWSFKRGETIYSLNAIPFGGFNKLSGEVDPDKPRSLASKSVCVRLLVLSGGILMNLLLPIILLSVAFMVPHNVTTGQIVVEAVDAGSPAEMAGIMSGDIILAVDGEVMNNTSEMARQIQLNLGKKIDILVEHGDSTREAVQLVPRWRPPEGQGSIGTLSGTTNITIIRQHYPFWRAIPMGVRSCIEALVLYRNGIIGMIVGTVPLVLAGPVGIVQVTGEVAKTGISPVLELAAFISIAIAVTQLLPIPALDGGHIVFVVLEWIRRGKRVSPKVEGMVHTIGFFMLMALMVAITYQDILRIISGESLIP